MDSDTSERVGRKITLPVIANELLDDIVSYLPTSDQLSAIRTCWELHDITARQLYRHITVSRDKAKRLFKTIAESKEVYGSHVRSLKYTASSNSDIYLVYILLCDSIPRMQELRNLSLTVRPQLSTFLLYLLGVRSIIHSDKPKSITAEVTRVNGRNYFETLPLLNTLNLHGDFNLVKLAQYRSVTTLYATEILDEVDLLSFIDILTNGTNMNARLLELTVTLHHTLGAKIGWAMWHLGFSFPGLRSLQIRTPMANALEASQILTVKPPIFPALRNFSLNDWTLLRPVYSLPNEQCMMLQASHIISAGNIRDELQTVSFGTIHWIRTMRRGSKWRKHVEVIQGASFFPQEFAGSDHPLFWDVDYDQPPPLSSLDFEILS